MPVVITLLVVALILLGIRYWKMQQENKRFKEDFKPILDIDAEVKRREDELKKTMLDADKQVKSKQEEIEVLKRDSAFLAGKYTQGKEVLQKLETEIKLYEGELELMEFGVYKPTFDLDSSDAYKNQIKQNKERQKQTIKDSNAAVCSTTWTVGNSQKEGERMVQRGIKMALRAFNGECDSLITKVKWNNIEQTEKRIQKAFEAINKLNQSNHIYITQEYLNLKIEELKLTHEYQLKKYEEKEEQRQIREQMREEEKVKKEIEKAQREAEKEEVRYQKALEKAQEELAQAQGEELDKLNDAIAKLQQELKEAQESKERAISQAQKTKSGHVYVISNIGSFGENIYKIGMTRRLEPMDRVKELGDASVPFQFDVHAMIYSENAPELENSLHKIFHGQRLNMINTRKEYFQVSLKDIEDAVKGHTDGEIEFTKIAEAKEYRETIVLRKNTKSKQEYDSTKVTVDYPETLF